VNLRPTPSQERWLTLARRFRGSALIVSSADTGGWRTANLLSRCALFVLGLIAAGMIGVIAAQLGPKGALVTAGLLAIAVAEWLILARRHFWSGIEEALEIAGLTLLAFECWSRTAWSSSAGERFMCAALAIAGLRLLNPLFTTLAVLALVPALALPPSAAGWLSYGIGLTALSAGAYRFRRPSHDRMLDWLVIVTPVAGYLWSASRNGAVDYLHAGATAWLVPLGPLVFAGVALATGVRRRTHAPIVAFMLCVACTAYELRRLTGLSLEARLILWGCVLLCAAMALERYLRIARGGVTSRPLREAGDSAGILGMAGSAVLAAPSPQTAPSFEGGGGRFGGAGASGEF
jgi:hypothetical protein